MRPELIFDVVPERSEQFLALKKTESNRDEFHVSDHKRKIADAMGLKKWVAERSIIEQLVDAGYPDKFFLVTAQEARDMANRASR